MYLSCRKPESPENVLKRQSVTYVIAVVQDLHRCCDVPTHSSQLVLPHKPTSPSRTPHNITPNTVIHNGTIFTKRSIDPYLGCRRLIPLSHLQVWSAQNSVRSKIGLIHHACGNKKWTRRTWKKGLQDRQLLEACVFWLPPSAVKPSSESVREAYRQPFQLLPLRGLVGMMHLM